MAEPMIKQTTPCDSPWTLYSFLMPKISAKFQRGHPQRGPPNRGWIGYNRRFSTNILLYLRNTAR